MTLKEARKIAESLRDNSDRKGVYLASVAGAIITLDNRITELERQLKQLLRPPAKHYEKGCDI